MQLCQLAFIYCLDALDEKTKDRSLNVADTEEAEGTCSDDNDDKLRVLILTYQVCQYAAKMQPAYSHRADKLLLLAYCMYIDIEVFAFVSIFTA